MKRLKDLLIITAVSIILAAGTVLLIVFDPSYVMLDQAGKVTSLVILPIWAFSVVPAFVFSGFWMAERLNMLQSFWLGYCLGLIIPLLIAPALTVFYFVGTIENLVRKK